MPSVRQPAQTQILTGPSRADRERIRAMVATWPPLTVEQRLRLRPVLAGTIPAAPLAVAS